MRRFCFTQSSYQRPPLCAITFFRYYRIMADVRDYIRLFDRNTILKWCFLVMLGGLFFIAESFLLVEVSSRYGTYPVFSILSGTALLGLLLVWPVAELKLKRIRGEISLGNFPEKEIHSFLGLLLSALFMLLPGFITDLLGIIIYFLGLRCLVGKIAALGSKQKLMEAYEYLKLYDL